tara:strand:- start:335 stop:454 length:120 start_codon:yes stop_codon:yes gene_type:complete
MLAILGFYGIIKAGNCIFNKEQKVLFKMQEKAYFAMYHL